MDATIVLGLPFRRISLSCGEIAYVDEGSGPVFVLLHGAPLTALGFVRVIGELRRHHRVIAPDLPGFGHSSRAASFDGSLAGYARAVEELCRALRLERFFLYVNDASGCLGLAAARLAADVAGIVVASTVPIPMTGLALPVKLILKHVMRWRLVRFLNRRLNLLAWLVATVAPLLRPFSAAERAALLAQFDTPEKRDRILDMFVEMGRDDAFMRATAAAVRERLRDTPALVLYGQLDPMRLTGAVGRYRRLFRNSAVRIVTLEEHFPILASGARVARMVHDWAAHIRSD